MKLISAIMLKLNEHPEPQESPSVLFRLQPLLGLESREQRKHINIY